MAGVTPLSPRTALSRLRKAATEAWDVYHAAKGERLRAELREHDNSSEANRRKLELARSDDRSARSTWLKAERARRDAETVVKSESGRAAA